MKIIKNIILELEQELKDIPIVKAEYEEDGGLIENSLSSNYWKIQDKKEKLEFMIDRLKKFIY